MMKYKKLKLNLAEIAKIIIEFNNFNINYNKSVDTKNKCFAANLKPFFLNK